MVRFGLLLVALCASMTISAGGCRSCSSCHDYDPPVANCNCDAYGTHRAGSACGGSCCGGGGCCGSGGCSGGGCSTCNGGGQAGSFSEGEYAGDVGYSGDGAMNSSPEPQSITEP